MGSCCAKNEGSSSLPQVPSISLASLIEAEAFKRDASEEDVAMVAELFSGLDVNDVPMLSEEDLCDCFKGKPLRVKVLARRVLNAAKGLSEEDIFKIRAAQSDTSGISAYYMMNSFKTDLAKAMGKEVDDVDAYHFVPGLLPMTKDRVCPRDGQLGCSFVDVLPQHSKGRANFYMCWEWKRTVHDLIINISLFVKQCGLDPTKVFLWICALCSNQHRGAKAIEKIGRERLTQGLLQRLRTMSGVIVVLDRFKQCSLLKRAWCVWEVGMAYEYGIPLHFACPPQAIAELEDVFKSGGIDSVKAAVDFKIVDIRATDPKDEALIKDDLSKIGFAQMEKKVANGMLSLVMPQLKKWMVDGLDEPRRMQEESEDLGISLHYLLHNFPEEAMNVSCINDPTFPELAPKIAYGEVALGCGKICPRDGKLGCSITDAMTLENKGAANKFLSWSWGYKLNDLIGGLEDWATNAHVDHRKTFLWVCFFCLNQFRMSEAEQAGGVSNLDEVFRRRLQRVGCLVALLDNWKQPRYLSRVWCVYEQFVAHELDIDVQVIFPPTVASNLRATLKKDFHVVRAALTNVDVEKCEGAIERDVVQVKEAIKGSVGFDAVNHVVRARFADWCAQEVARTFQNIAD